MPAPKRYAVIEKYGKDFFYQKYINDRLSIEDIAKIVNLSRTTVQYMMIHDFGFRKSARTMTFICEICQKKIIRPYNITQLKKKHHFCSRECNKIWKKNIGPRGSNHSNFKSKKINCPNCNIEFYTRPNRLLRAKMVFCSKKCLNEKQHEWVSGKNNGMWSGGGDIYYGETWFSKCKLIKQRDNNTCKSCGKTKTENKRSMDVHHILPIRKCININEKIDTDTANIDKNLACLCLKCHKIIEAEFIRFFKSLTQETQSFISTSSFYHNFYNSPNSIPQEIQEIILKSAPQNVRAAFIANLPVISLKTPILI